jgi:NCAIR mutase (PurE)-related protein
LTGNNKSCYYLNINQTRKKQMNNTTEINQDVILNKAESILKKLFPNKKFNLTYREWDRLVSVRKGNTKNKVFGYVEVSQAKTTWLPM